MGKASCLRVGASRGPVALLAGMLVAAPPPAPAATPATCVSAEISPGPTVLIPRNHPVAILRSGQSAAGLPHELHALAVRVTGTDGSEISFEGKVQDTGPREPARVYALGLDPTVAPGSYSVSFADICQGKPAAAAEPARLSAQILIGEAVAEPQVAITPRTSQLAREGLRCPERRWAVRTSGGIDLTLTPELRAYLPLLKIEVAIDGLADPEHSLGYGALGGFMTAPVDFFPLVWNATCLPSDTSLPGRLASGSHQAELRAHIAGAPAKLSTVTAAFLLDCADSEGLSRTGVPSSSCKKMSGGGQAAETRSSACNYAAGAAPGGSAVTWLMALGAFALGARPGRGARRGRPSRVS